MHDVKLPRRGTKTFHRKARTGCYTCKERHVKCDETKPTCLACRVRGYICLGYPFVRENLSKAISTRSSPNSPIFHNQEELQCFQFFMEVSMLWFSVDNDPCCFSQCSTAFFNPFILRLMDTEPAVKCLVLSIGHAHRHTLENPEEDGWQLERMQFFRKNYGAALRHLTTRLGASSTPDICLVLVCCILFALVDSLGHRPTLLMQHLQSGIRILKEFKAQRQRGLLPQNSQNVIVTSGLSEKESSARIGDSIGPLLAHFERNGHTIASYTRKDTHVRTKLLIERRDTYRALQEDPSSFKLPGLPCLHRKAGPLRGATGG